ncbi:alpha/beta hydrolase [Phenylobacterium sp. LjRoot219]|uniref:alpha/beta fold hydrolase n=1 Tax=Phenylobacterium sp. LjRoot219 TaxID=3342283 RepID=UPI003ECEADB2
MDATVEYAPRSRSLHLPSRGGDMAALEFGPTDRPIDVVFCHANGFNARTYRTILGPLGAELRILALDLRGHGATTLPAEPDALSGWDVFADDLLAALDVAVDRPVVLAGHSLGAITCLLAAVAAPARVRALVLFEPVMLDAATIGMPMPDHPITRATLRRRESFLSRAAMMDAYRGRGAFETWGEAQLADFAAGGLRDTDAGEVTLACRPAWEAAIYARQDVHAWEAMAELRAPARILAGVEGSSVGARARALAEQVGVPLEVVPGTTHFLPMERPELVRQALREAVG